MGTVIFVQFGDGPKITGIEYEAAAVRLEREAARQPDVTARQLRRLATSFRVRAAEGGS